MSNLIIVIYNFLILLLPYSLNFKGLTYSKILFAYSILVLIYLIIKKEINFKLFKNKTLKYLTIGFFSFLSIVSFSTLLNGFFNQKMYFTNLLEMLRVVEYYLVILNYYVLLKKDRKIFNSSLITFLLFNVGLAFFQFHNLFHLNEYYIKLIAPTQYETLVNNYPFPRAVALAGNPNVLGFLMALASVYILYLIINNYKKWYYYIIYTLIIITVFLSCSRTSYITLIGGNGLLILLTFFKFSKKDILKTIGIGGLFLVFQILLIFSLPEKYTWRIKGLVDFKNASSWQERVENNKEFISDLKGDKEEIPELDDNIENPSLNNKNKTVSHPLFNFIFGNGPDKLKEKHKDYFDNEWFMMIFNYGLVGTILFAFMLLFPCFSIKSNKYFKWKLYLTVIIMNFVYMIAAASYNCYLLFLFTSILIAYTLESKSQKF